MAKWFFKTLETGDLRYILKYEFLPELPEYDQSLLIDCWDNIQKEYDELTGEYNFEEHFMLVNDDLRELNELHRMKICYQLMQLQQKICLDELSELGIKLNDCSLNSQRFLKSKIMAYSTRLIIQQSKRKKEENKNTDYLKMLVDVENILNRNIDYDNITIKKWIFLIKSANEKIKILNSKNKAA